MLMYVFCSADEDADKKVIEAVLSSVSKPMVCDLLESTMLDGEINI